MSSPDIASILNSLSGEDLEALKNVASTFLGAKGKDSKSTSTDNGETAADSPLAGIDLSKIGLPDMSKFASLAPILEQITKRDDRTDFILALKPFLSEGRQPKADEAARLLKLINLIPLLRDRGIL